MNKKSGQATMPVFDGLVHAFKILRNSRVLEWNRNTTLPCKEQIRDMRRFHYLR